jgi:hypothetical protein
VQLNEERRCILRPTMTASNDAVFVSARIIDTPNIHASLHASQGTNLVLDEIPQQNKNRAGWNAMKRGIEF